MIEPVQHTESPAPSPGPDPDSLSALARNVAAGFRLGLFLPVSRADFRIGPIQFALLVAFNLVVAIVGSAVRLDFEGSFNPYSLSFLMAGVTVLLLVCLVVSRLLGNIGLLPAFAVMLASSDLLFELSGSLLYFALDRDWLPPWPRLPLAAYLAYVAWAAIVALRVQSILVPWRAAGSRAAALVLIGAVVAFAYVPREDPWVVVDDDDEQVEEPGDPDDAPSRYMPDKLHRLQYAPPAKSRPLARPS